jgi:hypothetical protein
MSEQSKEPKKPKEHKPSKKQMIFSELLNNTAIVEVSQQCPYTWVRIVARYHGEEYPAVGFSKVHWPDVWSAGYGIEMARNHAVGMLAKEIKNKV